MPDVAQFNDHLGEQVTDIRLASNIKPHAVDEIEITRRNARLRRPIRDICDSHPSRKILATVQQSVDTL
jgi:hypothetical protein